MSKFVLPAGVTKSTESTSQRFNNAVQPLGQLYYYAEKDIYFRFVPAGSDGWHGLKLYHLSTSCGLLHLDGSFEFPTRGKSPLVGNSNKNVLVAKMIEALK